MKVAVATASKDAHGIIPGKLAEAKYLFLVDVEKFEVTKVLCVEEENRDIIFAQETVKEDCEAIICGDIDQTAFEILAMAGVTRFLGTGETASRSIKLMNANQLPLIREYTGGPGCPGKSGSYEYHEHDD
jgi:predicted Fe-Mo cluster-binding NifX family protein